MWLGATALDRAAQDFRGWRWMAACVLAVGEVWHHAGFRQGAALCTPTPTLLTGKSSSHTTSRHPSSCPWYWAKHVRSSRLSLPLHLQDGRLAATYKEMRPRELPPLPKPSEPEFPPRLVFLISEPPHRTRGSYLKQTPALVLIMEAAYTQRIARFSFQGVRRRSAFTGFYSCTYPSKHAHEYMHSFGCMTFGEFYSPLAMPIPFYFAVWFESLRPSHCQVPV